MIYHMVWFKLRDDVSSEDKEFLKSQLEGMIPLIPEIVELHCGEDFSGRSRGFQWGLLVKFNTREDGQIYDKHPDHQAFIGRCKHLWLEVQALDFEA
ncbi:Dabb family protein [bacterium]|nr:MAG: Dabb family protein [bacterium]